MERETPQPLSLSAKVGIAFLAFAVLADLAGGALLVDMHRSASWQNSLGAGLTGVICFAVGVTSSGLGGLVAGVRTSWARRGERVVGVLCVAALFLSLLVGGVMLCWPSGQHGG